MAAERDLVVAELLLRRSNEKSLSEAELSKVQNCIREKGVTVVAVSAASISIKCERQTFERVFRTQLSVKTPPSAGSPPDYGALGSSSLHPETPPQVPEEITAEVQGVYIQEPPSLLGNSP